MSDHDAILAMMLSCRLCRICKAGYFGRRRGMGKACPNPDCPGRRPYIGNEMITPRYIRGRGLFNLGQQRTPSFRYTDTRRFRLRPAHIGTLTVSPAPASDVVWFWEEITARP